MEYQLDKRTIIIDTDPGQDDAIALASRIREIVMMAGCYFTRGNVTPVAEFNVYIDPHAANLVFQSGIPLTVLPLDVTHKALTTPARIEKLRKLGNRCGSMIAQILASYE